MFLSRRPSPKTIARFLEESGRLPLSYPRAGTASHPPPKYDTDETAVVIASGESGFERAKAALMAWNISHRMGTHPPGGPAD
jgi:uncharacterized protein (UPF0548 family)